MEEAELRLEEIRKSHYEFDRDIVKLAVNPQTNKVVAEKITRYFEDKLRARVSQLFTLYLLNTYMYVCAHTTYARLKRTLISNFIALQYVE